MSAHVETFALPGEKEGGKLINFTYSRSLGELVGTWNAEIANAPKNAFTAGDTFSMPCMANGYIERVWTDPDGMTHLNGKDAGVKLMRSTPSAQVLATGGASSVIDDLAGFCDMPCSVGGGLEGFNVRSAVTGTTCAEAILELAMLSGCIAYIDNSGKLQVQPPAKNWALPNIQLDDSGSELDLDGYASQVTVVVTRRKKTIAEEEPEGGRTYWRGTTHDGHIERDTSISGTFRYTDADNKDVSGSYAMTILRPIDAIEETSTTITRDGVTITTVETHDIDYYDKLTTRGDQEFRLFAWAERGYEITKTTEGSYLNAQMRAVSFKETTTETMTRTFDIFDVPWIDEDRKNNNPKLNMVARETIERVTVRDGTPPDANMPTFAPPFDMKLVREYKRMDFGRGLLISEVETKYEARQIGQIAKVKTLDPETGTIKPITVFQGLRHLALTTHTSPVWVPIVTVRTTYERYKDDGSCEVSTRSEWCDEGAKWLLANGLTATGDEEVDKAQENYAKFTQKASGLSVSLEGSSAGSVWQFLELPGRVKVFVEGTQYGGNAKEWYLNGSYVPSKICPHYESNDRQCGIYGISAIGDFNGEKCPQRGRGWQSCIRAKAALEQARSEEDRPLLEAPGVGKAGTASSITRTSPTGNVIHLPAAGYQREIYIDDIISEGTAQSIANQAAANILSVKKKKGLQRTVVIPYEPSVVPDGYVTSVNHDWANMSTTVSYRDTGYVPQFAVSPSVSGISDGVSGRNAGRRTRPMSGTVQSIQNGIVMVLINGMTYPCSTKLVNIGVGDSVLVSFSSGNSMHGHIVERM